MLAIVASHKTLGSIHLNILTPLFVILSKIPQQKVLSTQRATKPFRSESMATDTGKKGNHLHTGKQLMWEKPCKAEE